jgi:hypothetical protein
MKYLILKPGQHLAFINCIVFFMILPKMMLAQSNGDIDIEFHGRDTMVNGVNMKLLSAKDRRAARAQIAILNRLSPASQSRSSTDSNNNSIQPSNNSAAQPAVTSNDQGGDNNINTTAVIPAQTGHDNAGGSMPVPASLAPPVVAPATISPSLAPSVVAPATVPQSLAPSVVTPTAVPQSLAPPAIVPAPTNSAAVLPQYAASPTVAPVQQSAGAQVAVAPLTQNILPAAVVPSREFVRNTQTFDYTITSKEGISTHVSYYVSEPVQSDAKQIIGAYKPGLEIQDVSLVPQFWAGKTLLTFSLPDKTTAEVELTDNEGKAIWEDRIISQVFSKSFSWTLNGTYYLVVKQGGETAIKKIVKE